MKKIKIEKKGIIALGSSLIILVIIGICTTSFGMQHYYKVDFQTGMVTATTLNVRSGPSTRYNIVATVKQNEYIRVFAGIGDWYVVQVEGDYVGVVSKQYIKPIYSNSNNNSAGGSNGNNNQTNTNSMNINEKEVFDLINVQRKNNGLQPLKINEEVQRVARIKAQDMVDNNYFSHDSPTYGSPFDMLKSFKISYQSAGENIAGNSNNSSAVKAWMNSSGHRANILNAQYNQTGIGVVTSPKYGKIYVQLFIKK